MIGRLSGKAPSGTLKSCGGNGRPCEGTGLPSLLGAPPPPPPDWNLRRFSASCRPPVEPIPLPPWFLLPPRFLNGLFSLSLFPLSSSSSDGGGGGGTSQSAVGGATHLFPH